MRSDAPNVHNPWAALQATAAGLVIGGGAYGTVTFARWQDDRPFLSPLELLPVVLKGEEVAPLPSLIAGASLVVVPLLALAVMFGRWRMRRDAGKLPIDRKAQHMGDPAGFGRTAAGKLRPGGGDPVAAGSLYARSVGHGQTDLVMNGEDTMCAFFGPRKGKTTALVIPAIVDAPGAVIATSNKRDVPDSVRKVCQARGKFWVFDPLRLANYHGTAPTWWWNPLRLINTPEQARELAGIFASSYKPKNAQEHAYFDTKGPTLLGYLILAAAAGDLQLTDVYRWLQNPKDRQPTQILLDAGHQLPAQFLAFLQSRPGDERDGLYGTAANAVEFLADQDNAAWITNPGGGREEFDVTAFARSKSDTLMIMSRTDAGSATPMCTALLMTVTNATEKYAQTQPFGRLDPHMTLVLDEIANTAPWKQLPEKFSFYGSSGMLPIAILQSWSQGVERWGEEGMRAMWGASSLRLLGPGLSDNRLFNELVALIGKRWIKRTSVSVGGGKGSSGSRSTSYERDDILTTDEVGALPYGRVIVVPSGDAPILASTVPFFDRPDMAERVNASVREFAPKKQVVLPATAVSMVKP